MCVWGGGGVVGAAQQTSQRSSLARGLGATDRRMHIGLLEGKRKTRTNMDTRL